MAPHDLNLLLHRNSRFVERRQCSEEMALNLMKESIETKTRWLYTFGLMLIVANHIVDQISANFGMAGLPTSAFMIGGLLLLAARFFCIALNIRVSRVLVALLAVLLSFASWVLSGQSYLLVAAFLLLGIGNMDIRETIRTISAVILVLIAFLGLLQLLQFALTGDLPGATMREDGRLRLSFFFQHPNMLAAYIAMSYIGLSLSDREFKGGMAVLGCALAAICVWTTDSRTAGMIMVVYIALRLLARRTGFGGSVTKLVYCATPLFLTMLAVLASMTMLPDGLFDVLQKVLSGRPGYWELQYQQLGGFTLFGQHALSGTVIVNGWAHVNVTIDCFYAAALLSLGSWSLFVFYALYFRAGILASRERDFGVAIALFCCGLYGFTEIHMVDFSVAFPMLLLGVNLFCFRGEVGAE